MLHRCLNFLTSLRLTVVCLVLAIILVFVGTLAEVWMGLYNAQSEIFRSFLVYWTPAGSHLKIPVFPGGWLIGLTLLANLLAAHIKRFQFSRKKIGILLIHAGLIFLLAGQFITELCQVESQMIIGVGETRNYTEDSRKHELAVIDVTDPNHTSVVAIPESVVARGGPIVTPELPFTLNVKTYFLNSAPAGPMSGAGEKIKATQGIGQRLLFSGAPEAKRMDDENKPVALVEVLDHGKSLGDWSVSLWLSKHPLVTALQSNIGSMLKVQLAEPQTFTVAGHTYQIALRQVRYYKPYAVTLLEFKHDLYDGTDIPSNFSSKIHLSDPTHGEERDVLIHMNTPLRYGGETFYQSSFEPGDQVSILQVVRNPAAVTPYLACSLVALGLIVQFLSHLFGFAKKRAQAVKAPTPRVKPPSASREPVLTDKRSNI